MYRAVEGSSRRHGWRAEAPDEAVHAPAPEAIRDGSPPVAAEPDAPPAGAARAGRRAWNPAEGAPVDPRQRPPAPVGLLPDGTVAWKLRAPSEGPCRSDPGGAGGTPSGTSVPIHKVVWD